MRVVRVIIGTLLVVIALPMLVTGGSLWGAMQHRGSDGAFTARISPLATDGYAIVAPGLDGLLQREASFARGGQTTLRIAGTGGQPLFLGIGPTPDVERYLAGQAQARLTRVRLARGSLPVDLRQVPGWTGTAGATPPGAADSAGSAGATGPGAAAPAAPEPGLSAPTPMLPDAGVPGLAAPMAPAVPDPATAPAMPGPVTPAPVARILAPPATLPFWLAVSHQSAAREELTWSPSAMRGRDLSLVVMNATGAPHVSADLTATVDPRWLNPTTWGLLILGTVLFVLGSAALVWPRRHRDIVYVVEPSQLPEISARLGVVARAGSSSGGSPGSSAGGSASAGGAAKVLPAAPVTAGAREPGAVAPAPWFARVGGGLPHATSVASSGRQHTRLRAEEHGGTASRASIVAASIEAASASGADSGSAPGSAAGAGPGSAVGSAVGSAPRSASGSMPSSGSGQAEAGAGDGPAEQSVIEPAMAEPVPVDWRTAETRENPVSGSGDVLPEPLLLPWPPVQPERATSAPVAGDAAGTANGDVPPGGGDGKGGDGNVAGDGKGGDGHLQRGPIQHNPLQHTPYLAGEHPVPNGVSLDPFEIIPRNDSPDRLVGAS
jgi:hypothetical protein